MQEPTKYDSVFWIETEKIHPNPYQPRSNFNEERLSALAESIRQYGVLQPLVVTRTEQTKPDGGLASEYELIAGERRLRASKLIGLRSIPAIIRNSKEDARVKLEIAIIENLQREDLNAIDRANALSQLSKEFGLSNTEVGAKIGRSREYVSNSIRLLNLPKEIQQAVIDKEIYEGHARALLMLSDRPEQLNTTFRDIMLRKTSVRITEQLVRRIATDKIRKHNKTPEMIDLEKSLTERLGTRVVIENRPNGGRLLIEFFSPDDLSHIATVLAAKDDIIELSNIDDTHANNSVDESADSINSSLQQDPLMSTNTLDEIGNGENNEEIPLPQQEIINTPQEISVPEQQETAYSSQEEPVHKQQEIINTPNEKSVYEQKETVIPKATAVPITQQEKQEDDLYSIRNFTI